MTKTTVPIEAIHAHITEHLPGVIPIDAWGERSYFYNPGAMLKRGTYFATIKQKDGENDKSSHLDREGVWRLNIGLQKATFIQLFGSPPTRPAKGCSVEGPWDFTAQDTLMPHPVYGWMGWVAVVCPSADTWETCIGLLQDAHARAEQTFLKRTKI
ncbi:MAG: DUF6194 family protein [Devosiaceae bacterium]